MARRFSPVKARQVINQRAGSIRKVAGRMGRNMEQERTTIHKWLNGKHSPNEASLRRLAAAIPCEPEELLEDVEADALEERVGRLYRERVEAA